MRQSGTADRLDAASTELLLLLPRLEDALEKDSAPTEERAMTSGSPALSSPINPVVLDATVRLQVEIPMADARARSCLWPGWKRT